MPRDSCHSQVVIISKTFTTAETMLNAKTVKAERRRGDGVPLGPVGNKGGDPGPTSLGV